MLITITTTTKYSRSQKLRIKKPYNNTNQPGMEIPITAAQTNYSVHDIINMKHILTTYHGHFFVLIVLSIKENSTKKTTFLNLNDLLSN